MTDLSLVCQVTTLTSSEILRFTARTVLLVVCDWLKMALFNEDLRLVMSGGGSVGKKSIIRRFVDDIFTDSTRAQKGVFSRLQACS